MALTAACHCCHKQSIVRTTLFLSMLFYNVKALSWQDPYAYEYPYDPSEGFELLEAFEAKFHHVLGLDTAYESTDRFNPEFGEDDMAYIATHPDPSDSSVSQLDLSGDSVADADLVTATVQGSMHSAPVAAAPVQSSSFEATWTAPALHEVTADDSYEGLSAEVQDWISRTL